jgi:hypothetical protein
MPLEQVVKFVHTASREQTAAFRAIIEEREFQDRKHGHPDDNPHSIGAWLLTIEAELAEAKAAAIKGGEGRDNVINEIIQIAALCVACLEQHGTEPLEGRQV